MTCTPPPPPIHLLPLDKSKGSLDRVPASLEKRVGEPDQSSPTTANMCSVSNRHRRSAIFLPIVVIFYSWVLCCAEEWGQANSCNFNQNANVNTNTKNAFSSDMVQHCDQLISHFESVFLKQKISSILEYFITASPWIPDEDVANNESKNFWCWWHHDWVFSHFIGIAFTAARCQEMINYVGSRLKERLIPA